MEPFECFQCNPSLIANDLGDAGFVLYVPPNPRPLRISSSLWHVINSVQKQGLTPEEWSLLLSTNVDSDYQSEHGLKWLISQKILLPVRQLSSEKTVDNQIDTHHTREVSEIGDIGESSGFLLFSLNPDWPFVLQRLLHKIFQLQLKLLLPMGLIVFGYLLFFVFTPSPTALSLLIADSDQSSSINFLTRTVVALLTVNLFSTCSSWLSQSITGLGDGKILLRFLFGFIPRFGVNPYKGAALQSRVWNREAKDALICLAQPLLMRLCLASVLILLFATGRLHSGLAGGHLYEACMVMLQISLISGLVLALPFRMSPGYRLMILLTDLPMNTMGRSARHCINIFYAFWSFLGSPDQRTFLKFRSLLSSKHQVGLFLFGIIFLALIAGKLILILLLVIPRIAADSPDFLGGATRLVLTLVLLFLFAHFIRSSILPKFRKLTSKRDLNVETSLLSDANAFDDKTSLFASKYIRYLVFLGFGCFLLVPINRTVTGSVLVSTQRDLTLRAPEDVVVTAIYQEGPSSNVVELGSRLVKLESSQLLRDIYQSELESVQLNKEIDVLTGQSSANQSLLDEFKDSLSKYQLASKNLLNQQIELEQLSDIGAASRQALYEIELEYFKIKEDERLKRQQILELQAEMNSAELKIKSLQHSLNKSQSWRNVLLKQKEQLSVVMPFSGLITSSTSGLMGSFVAKGETLMVLKQGSLDRVDVLIPDHDRSNVQLGQNSLIRLYANPNESLRGIVQSIRPAGELVDGKVFFEATLHLEKPLSPQLLQSSGAARINAGQTNLFSIFYTSLARFFRVDVWSWTP